MSAPVLKPNEAPVEVAAAYFACRTFLPEFEVMQQIGAFRPKPESRDITDLIAEERDGR